MCLKLYRFERITWWCLYVLESILESTLQSILEFVMLIRLLKKKGMVSHNLCQAKPPIRAWKIGGGLDEKFDKP